MTLHIIIAINRDLGGKMKNFDVSNEFRNYSGEYIKKNILEAHGITQKKLAELLNVSRQTINHLVKGTIHLTPTMALKLSSAYGESVEFWLNLEDNYKDNRITPDDNKRNLLIQKWKTQSAHTLVDFEIKSALELGMLGSNFSANSIQPASYDLRIGEKAIFSSTNKKHKSINLIEETPLFEPHSIAVLSTKEKIEFPKFLLGRLGSMTSLTSNAIIALFGAHVDPGFKGVLYITLINLGNNKFPIEYEQPFITMEISYLSMHPKNPYSSGINVNRENFSASEIGAVKPIEDTNIKENQSFTTAQLAAARQLIDSFEKK